ncbi:hypothetical protein JIN77_03985 [Verrucomicrobiaceae bacterium R5-34]|nr:hypothetical protein [Verrucomicrobiaceae bacterium R5-34]
MAQGLHMLHPTALKFSQLLSLGAAACLSLAPVAFAQDNKTEPEEKQSFGALDVLPAGSILRRVRLPRYDQDFNPVSLLTAETLTVLDDERIDGLGLTFQLYDDQGKVSARTKMRHAIYNQKRATLHASEAVFIQGKGFVVSGTGMVCDIKKNQNRIFIFGPVSSKFTRATPKPSTAMQLKPPFSPRAIAGSLITLTGLSTSLMAEPASHLTEAQLAELDEMNRSIKHQIEEQRETITTTLEEDRRLDSAASASMRPFLKSIGQAALLVQTDASEKKAPAPVEKGVKEAPAKKPADPKAAKVDTLKVECEGGLYFDSDTGILAYLKNVSLTEARFHLSCSDELKVFLDQKPAPAAPKAKASATETDKPKAEAKAETKAETKPKAEPESGLSSFGDLKRIIATGDVKVTRKDDQGKLFVATAATASYDAKTGEMILRGGRPRLQLGPNQFLQSRTDGAYIRILKNGKLTTSRGRWTMETPVKQAP